MPDMSGMVGDAMPVEHKIHLSVEEQSRLVEVVALVLGSSGEWTPAFERQLSSLARGFQLLASVQPTAERWRDGLTTVLHTRPVVMRVERQVHRLGILIESQPTLMPAAQTNACHVLAAMTFASLCQGVPVSGQFLKGLAQLFRSTTPEWVALRQAIALPALFTDPPEEVNGPELLKNFARALPKVLQSSVTFPLLGKRNSETAGQTEEATGAAEGPDKKSTAKPSKFNAHENRELSQFQIVQQEQEPTLASYRPVNDWNCLTPSEFAECCSILVGQLRCDVTVTDHLARRLHAAARFVSMLAQLSLEIAASLPLERKGSIHLDLDCGILRRDLSVVAPRTDRSRGARWRGRWTRTPLPPEVLSVLVAAKTDHPEARTLGDLLIAEKLTPENCYVLLNSERKEGRAFESLRVARSLRPFFLLEDIHPSVISRVLGDITIVPRAHQYYLLLDQEEVHAAVNRWCVFAGLIGVNAPQAPKLIGSPKALTFEEMKAAFNKLQQQHHKDRMSVTSRSGLRDVLRFHRDYLCRYVIQLTGSLGGRCQNLASITARDLFADPEMVVLADRASDRYSQRRVCVLTEPLVQSRLQLAEHFLAIANRLENLGQHSAAKALTLIASGADPEACVLQVFYTHKKFGLSLRPITRADLKKVARSIGLPDLNAPRHFLITTLVQKRIAAVAIDALVGHHQPGAPPFGFGSGMSILEFCSYMKPVLGELHRALEISPLQGLGRTDPGRWKLPTISAPDLVPPPESEFLRQRLQVDDFNPVEVFLTEEDCPISPDSLAARGELERLRSEYKRRNEVKLHPWGSVAFCLIAFNAVIVQEDHRAFIERLLVGADVNLGPLRAVEVFETQELPIAQCLLAPTVVDALQVARRNQTAPSFAEVLSELDLVVRSLNPRWPANSASESLARLLGLSAHAAMVELSSVARFGLVHKAPFIPASDLARLLSHEPTRVTRPLRVAASKCSANTFESISAIVRRHAERDIDEGEATRRRHATLQDLAEWEGGHAVHEAEALLLEFLRAELRDAPPPYRRLRLPTVAAYLTLQIPFFAMVRTLGRLPQSADEWAPMEKAFEDEDKSEGRRRWAGMHIAAWLREKGVPVPPALGKPELTVEKRFRPHLSAYVLLSEVEHALDLCHAGEALITRPGWDRLQLRISRLLGPRPAELRYLKARHVCPSGAHIVITTSGHDHLKTEASRGLLSVPDELRAEVQRHREGRLASPAGRSSAMFVPGTPNGYDLYDRTNSRIQDAIRAVTGREDFRMYDLRANALTDLVFDVPGALDSLAEGRLPVIPLRSADDLNRRFARAGWAAREARQASVHTLLRYYYLGGGLERHFSALALDQSHPAQATYTAALKDKTVDAIYARRSRARRGAGVREACSDGHPARTAASSNEPQRPSLTLPQSRRLFSEAAVKGVVLHLAGCSLQVASDHVGVPIGVVKLLYLSAHANLERAGVDALSPMFSRSDTSWGRLLDPACDWAFRHRTLICRELAAGKGIASRGAGLRMSGIAAFDRLRAAWGGLQARGIRPVLSIGANQALEEKVALRARCASESISVRPGELKRAGFAEMNFWTGSERDQPKNHRLSAHVIGKVGRLVVASMIVAASAGSMEVL